MELLTIAPIKIEKSAAVCGGAPRISGTRIRVIDIIVPYRMGKSPEEIVQMYPHISLSSVHTALAYYFAHKEEIDKDEKKVQRLIQLMRRRYPSKAA